MGNPSHNCFPICTSWFYKSISLSLIDWTPCYQPAQHKDNTTFFSPHLQHHSLVTTQSQSQTESKKGKLLNQSSPETKVSVLPGWLGASIVSQDLDKYVLICCRVKLVDLELVNGKVERKSSEIKIYDAFILFHHCNCAMPCFLYWIAFNISIKFVQAKTYQYK